MYEFVKYAFAISLVVMAAGYILYIIALSWIVLSWVFLQ